MKKTFFLLALTTCLSTSLNGQTESNPLENRLENLENQVQEIQEKSSGIQEELNNLKSNKKDLQQSIYGLSAKNKELVSQIDSLNEDLSDNLQAVNDLDQESAKQDQELSARIAETRKTTSQSVSQLDEALSKNTLYWIIAVLTLGVLALIALIFLRKKVTKNHSSINKNLANTRKELEQEAIRLDEKLIQVMENQMKVMQQENNSAPDNKEKEQDHSLAKKVADEIVRIEKNLGKMEKGTKGLKQLSRAVQHIKDNFESNGYEIVEMVGKTFDERMKASIVNTIPDDNLEEGEQVITRIIKPQINYNGVMIQSAEIEVSVG